MTEGGDFLSQEELDALLGAIKSEDGSDTEKESGPDQPQSGDEAILEGALDNREKDMIGEVGNMIMGSASTALYTILGRKVEITTPQVSTATLASLKNTLSGNQVVINLEFSKGITGLNVLVMDATTTAIIADLMMGGTGEDVAPELDDIKLSAVSEAMNQMMGSASTSMSDYLKTPIDMSPPTVSVLDFDNTETKFPPLVSDESEETVAISFDMEIDGLTKTKLIQVLPIPFVKSLYQKVADSGKGKKEEPKSSAPTPQPVHEPAQRKETAAQPHVPSGTAEIPNGIPIPPIPPKQQPVNVRPVEFEGFDLSALSQLPKHLELLYEVPLEITVELGRSKMTLKEILDVSIGSLIELDKLTGEHMDILVNGKLLAKGEVVVVDENFGIRITEIVDPKERLRSLK